MQQIVTDYWPKLLAGIVFIIASKILLKRPDGKNSVLNLGGMFLISPSLVSLYTYFILDFVHDQLKCLMPTMYIKQIYVAEFLIVDFLTVIIGIFLFQKLIKGKRSSLAAFYLEFSCIERFTMIVAFSKISYVVTYGAAFWLFSMAMAEYVDYVERKDNFIRWKSIDIYLIALFIFFNILYGASYFFSELQINEFNPASLWLDTVACFSGCFIVGIIRLNLREAKQYHGKLKYMKKFQKSQEKIIQTFSEIMEAKSGETGQHVKRVAKYSVEIAKKMKLEKNKISFLMTAAMLHDIGKLMIPREIIEKPGALTDEEFNIMKTHTIYGEQLMENSEGEMMEMAKKIAREHHEQWDGNGYPDGKKEYAINQYARIVAVADVYDALTSERAYKKAWPSEEAKAEIECQNGKKFCPEVVEAFILCYDRIEEIRRMYRD